MHFYARVLILLQSKPARQDIHIYVVYICTPIAIDMYIRFFLKL